MVGQWAWAHSRGRQDARKTPALSKSVLRSEASPFSSLSDQTNVKTPTPDRRTNHNHMQLSAIDQAPGRFGKGQGFGRRLALASPIVYPPSPAIQRLYPPSPSLSPRMKADQPRQPPSQ